MIKSRELLTAGILAKDQFVRRNIDQLVNESSNVSSILGRTAEFDEFRMAYNFYVKDIPNSNGLMMFHLPVKVKGMAFWLSMTNLDFFKTLFTDNVYSEMEKHFHGDKWRNIDNAYVNFSHWAVVKGHPDDFMYSRNGLYYL